jgi:hypothetical protein
MSTLLDRVYQGADGSAHFLSSTPDRSVLIITDPVLGKDEITFDGPVRLLPPRAGATAVAYESISASGSTTVQVSPGQQPAIRSVGSICVYCCFPPVGQLGRGHDYGLWPVCPGEAQRRRDHAPGSSTSTAARPVEAPQGPTDGPAQVPVPDREAAPELVEPPRSGWESRAAWGPGPGADW